MSKAEMPFLSVWFPGCSLSVFRPRAGKFLCRSWLDIWTLRLRLPLIPAHIDHAVPVPLIIPFRSCVLGLWLFSLLSSGLSPSRRVTLAAIQDRTAAVPVLRSTRDYLRSLSSAKCLLFTFATDDSHLIFFLIPSAPQPFFSRTFPAFHPPSCVRPVNYSYQIALPHACPC